MALIAGMFSAISGIAICILREGMTEQNFLLAVVLNIINTTILFGTPGTIYMHTCILLLISNNYLSNYLFKSSCTIIFYWRYRVSSQFLKIFFNVRVVLEQRKVHTVLNF